MGGDGGVVATNRRYMRGAGTADHTADGGAGRTSGSTKAAAAAAIGMKADEVREALEVMTTCALTHVPLRTSSTNTSTSNNDPSDSTSTPLVACRYGRMYVKEAIVERLLQRKQDPSSLSLSELQAIQHIQKLSDLMSVRGQFTNVTDTGTDTDTGSNMKFFSCPITGKVLKGPSSAILLHPGNLESFNVISASGQSHLSSNDMEAEYGPIHRQVILAPTSTDLLKMKQDLHEEKQQQQEEKQKNKKKRKHEKNKKHSQSTLQLTPGTMERDEKSSIKSEPKRSRMMQQASQHTMAIPSSIQSRVQSTIQSNQVLSSLFVKRNRNDMGKQEQTGKSISKEQKDALFAR